MSETNMEEPPVQDAEAAAAQADAQPKASPGQLLAARREELGLTVEGVAEQLKMTPRQILAIEAENYDAVHGKAIYKGFVRAYAKVLKMDQAALTAMIPDDKPEVKKVTSAKRNASDAFTGTRMPVLGQRNQHSKKMMVAIAAVTLLILVLIVQKMGWIPNLPKIQMTRADKGTASAPASAVQDIKPEAVVPVSGADGKIKQIELPPVDVSSQLASAPVPAASAQAPGNAAALAAAPVPSGNVLVLKCREETWVELKRADGSVLAARRIAAGSSETFEITEPVQLTLGNGPGVEATLRGVPLEIPVDANSKVVHLNLK